MFPNLNAEQSRREKTNSDMADFLGISRVAYEARKKEGRFSIADANKLCEFFDCDYIYLFSKSILVPRTWVNAGKKPGDGPEA